MWCEWRQKHAFDDAHDHASWVMSYDHDSNDARYTIYHPSSKWQNVRVIFIIAFFCGYNMFNFGNRCAVRAVACVDSEMVCWTTRRIQGFLLFTPIFRWKTRLPWSGCSCECSCMKAGNSCLYEIKKWPFSKELQLHSGAHPLEFACLCKEHNSRF